ncbi:MAG: Mth938-like domain-containing protein [Paracoccaceae bacterium]
MRLVEISYDTAHPVQGYGPGFFRVGDHVLRGACLITPWDAGLWGGLNDTATPLTLTGRIDVLLLGMGAEVAYPPAGFVTALQEAGIGVEAMTSPAACRTYNVLLGEGRRIAAALLPVA